MRISISAAIATAILMLHSSGGTSTVPSAFHNLTELPRILKQAQQAAEGK